MRVLLLVGALSLLAACSPIPSAVPSKTWLAFQRGLPTHATVLSLEVDPQDPQTIFAGAYDATGAYVTTDQTRTWRASGDGLDHPPILALRWVDRSLFAATGAGLYRRRDSRWQRVNTIPSVAVYSISRGRDGSLYVSTDGRGIFASADGGETWARIPGLDGESILSILSVSSPREDASSVDAGTLVAGTGGRGVYVTRNGGKTWRALDPFGGDYASLLVMDPRDGQSIYLRTRGGLFRSRDAGATWQLLRGGIETEIANALLFDATAPRIYAATGGRGVFASDDDGATWRHLGEGLPQGIATLALAQIDAHTLLAGTQNGIYITRDTGVSWQAANEGVGVPQLHALALDRQTGRLYAATEDGLYRADMNGDFEPLRGAEMRVPMLSVALAPDHPGVIYAGAYRRGIFVSDDGGASWNPAGDIFAGRLSPTGLTVDPQNENNLFARVLFERIYKSTDGGDTWHAVWTGMPDDAEVETMSIAPSDPTRMFAGTNDGIYSSRDAGESWARSGLSQRSVLAIWIDPRDPRGLLAGATDGLYRSDDAGATWTLTGLERVTVTAIVRAANGGFLAGTKYSGVWLSRDNAETWERLGEGMDAASVIALIGDDARGVVYAATTQGNFKMTLP